MTSRRRVAILISGRGSNMLALAEAAHDPDYPAEIVLVLSNVADAPGLAAATARGIPTATVSHRDYPEREAFEAAMDAVLRAHQVELVVLAGFMRILTPAFIDRYAGRILNIHPSLLPQYQGLDTHRRALAAGDSHGGCTVHIVTAELDGGPPLGQAQVPILPGDTPESLGERVRTAEHRLYPRVLAEFCRQPCPTG